MTIVDELLDNTGTYIGIDSVQGSELRGAARMIVSALPGESGVSLEYEILNPTTPDRIRGHIERTIIGRTHDGPAVMVIGHEHANSVAILRETEPGVFELGDEPSPFPMKVVVTVLGPGHLRHSWWYGRPGDVLVERDVAEMNRID
jgi:hypothetical protein